MPQLHNLIDCIKAGRIVQSFSAHESQLLGKRDPKFLSWLIKTASNAICFDCGPAWEVPELKIINELFKAPYPITWLEFKMIDGVTGVLVEENAGYHSIFVLQKREYPFWEYIGYGEIYVENDDLKIAFEKHLADGLNGNQFNKSIIDHLRSVAKGTANVFMALNCSNVHRVEHKAPKLINRQRAKKGKQPIFSYWTLHLPNTSNDGPSQGGTHASPRVHLRRGHIRQFSPGRYTWVNACVVGNPESGMVSKDYAFSAPTA